MLETIVNRLALLQRRDPLLSLALETEETNAIDRVWCVAVCVISAVLYALLVFTTGGVAAERSIGGVWFQSDGWRVFDDMVSFRAVHFRDSVHPLFSMISIPITSTLSFVLGVSSIESIYIVNMLLCCATISMLFLIARRMACSRIDSTLLCLTFLTSASAIFWFIVPETYPAGCAAIVLCFYILVMQPKRDWYFVIPAALSLGTTVTNWIAGLIVAATSRSPWRAALIAMSSFLMVALCALAAKAVFPYPGSPFFLPAALFGERSYAGHADSGSLFDRLAGQLVTSIIAPEHKLLYNQPTGAMNSFQSTIPATMLKGDIVYIAAATALLYLLAVSTLRTIKQVDRFSFCVMVALAGQMGLHIIYGEETFLYGLHFAPLIIMVIIQAFRSQPGVGARIAISVLLVFGLCNNLQRLRVVLHIPFMGTGEYLYRLSP